MRCTTAGVHATGSTMKIFMVEVRNEQYTILNRSCGYSISNFDGLKWGGVVDEVMKIVFVHLIFMVNYDKIVYATL